MAWLLPKPNDSILYAVNVKIVINIISRAFLRQYYHCRYNPEWILMPLLLLKWFICKMWVALTLLPILLRALKYRRIVDWKVFWLIHFTQKSLLRNSGEGHCILIGNSVPTFIPQSTHKCFSVKVRLLLWVETKLLKYLCTKAFIYIKCFWAKVYLSVRVYQHPFGWLVNDCAEKE